MREQRCNAVNVWRYLTRDDKPLSAPPGVCYSMTLISSGRKRL